MSDGHDSLAVVAHRVSTCETAISRLVSLSEGQAALNHSMQENVKIQQLRLDSAEKRIATTEKKTDTEAARIDSLVATREQMRGGWFALTIIATCLCTLAGFLGAWINHKMGH